MNIDISEIVKIFTNHDSQVVSLIVGILVPAIISAFFSRKGTVKFGILIYKFLGSMMLQKRATCLKIPSTKFGQILYSIRTTFVDLSFGVYIASRKDLSSDEQSKKIDDYLSLAEKIANTQVVENEKQDIKIEENE